VGWPTVASGHKKKGGQSADAGRPPLSPLTILGTIRPQPEPGGADRVWVQHARAHTLRGVEQHERLVGVGITEDARPSRSLIK
jgi:hypothetical protein